MTITVEGPGGVIIEFPDGTDPGVMKQAMQRHFSPERQQSSLESAGRGALQGASFGLSDEIGAGVEAASTAGSELMDFGSKVFNAPMRALSSAIGVTPDGSLSESAGKLGAKLAPAYDKSLEEIRAANDQSYKQNPWAYTGGQLVGGVATTAIPVVGQLGRTAQGASLGVKSYQGAKAGAVLGGVSGFGHSRGGVAERTSGAVMGAGAGGALGGTLPLALAGGGAVVNAIGTRVQAARDPAGRGQSLVAQALADDIASNATTSGAGVRVNRKLQQAQGAPDIRRANPNDAAPGDPTLRLMDVGGENTRNLLRSAANQKSPAANTLNKHLDTRQASQNKRIERGVMDLVRRSDQVAGKTSIFTGQIRELVDLEPERVVDELVAQSRSKGGPLFDLAFQSQIPVTQNLIDVVNRPGIKRLAELAQETATNEGKDLATVSPVELLHMVKMQIDRQIGAVKRGIQDSKANWDVRTLVQMKKDLVNAIEVPAYKKALKEYAGPAAIRNAFEDGFDDGLSATPAAIRKTLSRMSKDEAVAYRYGVARRLIQKSRSDKFTSDRTKGIFGTPDALSRARAIAESTADYRSFQKLLVKEAKMSGTRGAVQGNSTTAKQLTQLAEGGQAVSSAKAAGSVLLGRLGPVIDVVGRKVASLGGMTPEVANEVIKAAMATTGNQSQIALQKAIARARTSDAGQDELARLLLRMGVQVMNGTTERRQ